MSLNVWRVGALSRQTGVSVRTLHHYDEIGLLSPTRRSTAGYRLYTEADIARLQQIRGLRDLGFALEEIRALLDRSDVSVRSVIALQIRRLRERIDLQRTLCERLEVIADRLLAAEQVSVADFIQALGVMNMIDKAKSYYTAEQLATLEQRRQTVGEERIQEVEAEWPELMARVRAARDQGIDPADEQVQALARHWRALIAEFTGGDPGIAQSLGTMYQNEPAVREQSGVDPAIFAYIGKAFAVLDAAQ